MGWLAKGPVNDKSSAANPTMQTELSFKKFCEGQSRSPFPYDTPEIPRTERYRHEEFYAGWAGYYMGLPRGNPLYNYWIDGWDRAYKEHKKMIREGIVPKESLNWV
jgi:hypothetical protein